MNSQVLGQASTKPVKSQARPHPNKKKGVEHTIPPISMVNEARSGKSWGLNIIKTCCMKLLNNLKINHNVFLLFH